MLAALIPFAAVVGARWTEVPSALEGDYAQYLLHAKAIAEGRPYSDIGYIYTSMNLVGPRLQPPGWPLVLSPFVAAFGTQSPAIKGLMVLLVAAFGVTAGAYVARRFGAVAGIVTAAFVPLALETQYATGSALSDPLFCLLVWLALLVADADGEPTWRRGIVLAVLCGAALSVRVVGIALPPALVLFAFVRWRKERVKVVLPIAALFILAGVASLAVLDSVPFLDRLLRNIVRSPLVLPSFLRTYGQAVASSALYPLWSRSANDAYHFFMAVPLVVGAVLFYRQHFRSAVACFFLMYAGVLFLSPVRETRYAWPLYPLTAVMFASGLLWLGIRFAPVTARRAVPGFVLGFLGLVVVSAAINVARTPERPSMLSDAGTVALFDWLKTTNETTQMRVVFVNPRVLTLETGIPAMGIPFGEPADVVAELDRTSITHVVMARTHVTRVAERNLASLLSARPEMFPIVFANSSHEVHLFIARPATATDSGAVRSPNGK